MLLNQENVLHRCSNDIITIIDLCRVTFGEDIRLTCDDYTRRHIAGNKKYHDFADYLYFTWKLNQYTDLNVS